MTAALIAGLVLVIAIIFFAVPGKKQNAVDDRNRNIVNLELQDELSCYYFKMIVSYLEKRSHINPKRPNAITFYYGMDLLYGRYGLQRPFELSDEKRRVESMTRTIEEMIEAGDYPEDDKSLPLEEKIWYYPYTNRRILTSRPDLLYGDPYSEVEVDGIKYKYDEHGKVVIDCCTLTSFILMDLVWKLTQKTLKEYGYNYSPKREIPISQRYPAYPLSFKDNPCVLLTDPKDIANYNEYGLDFKPTYELKQRMDAAGVHRIVNPEYILQAGSYYKKRTVEDYFWKRDLEAEDGRFIDQLEIVGGLIALAIGTPMMVAWFLYPHAYSDAFAFFAFALSMIGGGFLLPLGLVTFIRDRDEYNEAMERREKEKKRARK